MTHDVVFTLLLSSKIPRMATGTTPGSSYARRELLRAGSGPVRRVIPLWLVTLILGATGGVGDSAIVPRLRAATLNSANPTSVIGDEDEGRKVT